MFAGGPIAGFPIGALLAAAVTAPPVADTTRPTINAPLVLSAVTASGAHAAWPAGADNVAVAGYEISVDTGTPTWIDVGNVLSCDISGKTESTTYTVRVRDYDAAGNRSATSITAQLTTAAPATPPVGVGPIDAAMVPASRAVVFEGSIRVVIFDGSDNKAGT